MLGIDPKLHNSSMVEQKLELLQNSAFHNPTGLTKYSASFNRFVKGTEGDFKK